MRPNPAQNIWSVVGTSRPFTGIVRSCRSLGMIMGKGRGGRGGREQNVPVFEEMVPGPADVFTPFIEGQPLAVDHGVAAGHQGKVAVVARVEPRARRLELLQFRLRQPGAGGGTKQLNVDLVGIAHVDIGSRPHR